MFEALMRNGGYRVDYLNMNLAGSQEALGFYVRGQLQEHEPYSREAKHHLYAGMMVIQELLGSHNLVSVYLDVNDPNNLQRPGYLQMKEDLRDGLFHRVFTFDLKDLLGSPQAVADLCKLYEELGGFDLMTYETVYDQMAVYRYEGFTTQPCPSLAA